MITTITAIVILTVLLTLQLARLFDEVTPKQAVTIFIAGSIISIPGALLPLYYLHLFDDFPWYYEFRSVPYIELTMIFFALPLAVLHAKIIKDRGRTIMITTIIAVSPFIKQIISPLDHSRLMNRVVGAITQQTSSSTCGPSSAATLLRHFSVEKTEQDIARAAHTTRTGTEIWYIKRYLTSIGIESEFIIDKDGPVCYPAIAGIKLGTIGHFIAVIDKQGGNYIIGDPLHEKKVIPEEELQKQIHFTGFYLKLNKY